MVFLFYPLHSNIPRQMFHVFLRLGRICAHTHIFLVFVRLENLSEMAQKQTPCYYFGEIYKSGFEPPYCHCWTKRITIIYLIKLQ